MRHIFLHQFYTPPQFGALQPPATRGAATTIGDGGLCTPTITLHHFQMLVFFTVLTPTFQCNDPPPPFSDSWRQLCQHPHNLCHCPSPSILISLTISLNYAYSCIQKFPMTIRGESTRPDNPGEGSTPFRRSTIYDDTSRTAVGLHGVRK